jgi:hypothetical protein
MIQILNRSNSNQPGELKFTRFYNISQSIFVFYILKIFFKK